MSTESAKLAANLLKLRDDIKFICRESYAARITEFQAIIYNMASGDKHKVLQVAQDLAEGYLAHAGISIENPLCAYDAPERFGAAMIMAAAIEIIDPTLQEIAKA